jgi:hypothetical protein
MLQADGNEVRGDGLEEKRGVDYFGGLEVSVKESSISLMMTRQDREGSEGSERSCSPAEGAPGRDENALQARGVYEKGMCS